MFVYFVLADESSSCDSHIVWGVGGLNMAPAASTAPPHTVPGITRGGAHAGVPASPAGSGGAPAGMGGNPNPADLPATAAALAGALMGALADWGLRLPVCTIGCVQHTLGLLFDRAGEYEGAWGY